MFRNRGLAFKLSFFILVSCTLIFTVIFAYNYRFSSLILREKIEENARNLSRVTVGRIETVLKAVEKSTNNIAYSLENPYFGREELFNLLRSFVADNADIYGSTASFEPYAFDKKSLYFGPYFYESNGRLRFTYLDEKYDYFHWDWYIIPRELNRPLWSEPYYDEGAGNILMSTYSAPFYRKHGGHKKFAGVVTADVSLAWLQKIISSIRIGKTGYGFLISKNGGIVTHPLGKLVMNETIFSIAEKMGYRELREIGRQMIKGKSGFVPFKNIVNGRTSWLRFEPVPSAGWSLGVVFPQEELMDKVIALNRVVLTLGLAGFLFLLVVIIIISGTITRPLRLLAARTRDVAAGNLDFELPPTDSKDEVGMLSEMFLSMRNSLKQYIRDLTLATAARERIESELKIAHDIQMGMVPKTFPPFPERKEFDLYAVLKPAREVGGDFYDFFMIDESHLCFAIGDVSGKGVPAALFMAITMTLIRNSAMENSPPAEVLEKINREFLRNNDSFMFVTVFCGILNIETGEVHYVNAGHNPPLMIPASGEVYFLSGPGGPPVGFDEETTYAGGSLTMQPGDALCMYTDGVTEAFNGREEQFTAERLQDEVILHRNDSIREIIEAVIGRVESFAGGEPQSDDITLQVLKYLDGRRGRPEGG
jgi:sigma-B regulation protein RsbU (phosphoserine phosphatase)